MYRFTGENISAVGAQLDTCVELPPANCFVEHFKSAWCCFVPFLWLTVSGAETVPNRTSGAAPEQPRARKTPTGIPAAHLGGRSWRQHSCRVDTRGWCSNYRTIENDCCRTVQAHVIEVQLTAYHDLLVSGSLLIECGQCMKLGLPYGYSAEFAERGFMRVTAHAVHLRTSSGKCLCANMRMF
jgi:hypothetical protein